MHIESTKPKNLSNTLIATITRFLLLYLLS